MIHRSLTPVKHRTGRILLGEQKFLMVSISSIFRRTKPVILSAALICQMHSQVTNCYSISITCPDLKTRHRPACTTGAETITMVRGLAADKQMALQNSVPPQDGSTAMTITSI